MKTLLCAIMLALSSVSYAKNITKKMRVNNLQWDDARSLFRLEIHGHAGAYFADKKHLECLKKSALEKKEVNISYDVHKLLVSKCQ